MIVSFGDKAPEAVFHDVASRALRHLPKEVLRRALNKLDVLNAAQSLRDLRSPPGNRLEALRGDLEGFFSVRVNDQWRIVFAWHDGNAAEVRLTDYH